MKDYKNAVCRGSWALGKNCGRCERCEDTKPSAYATTASMPSSTITYDDVMKAIKSLSDIPENKEFMLVTPDGKMYKGEFDKVFAVMLKHHPMMQFGALDYGAMQSQDLKPNDNNKV